MKKVKSFLLAALLTLTSISRADEPVKPDVDFGADIVSRYLWRGQMLGASAAFQPFMGITYGGLSFGTWGSFSFSDANTQEVDLLLSYTFKSITVGINDYFPAVDTLDGTQVKFFNYKNKTTRHTLEPYITFTNVWGTSFSGTAAVFVYGDDKNEETGKNNYSNYFEVSYANTTNLIDYSFFVGGTLKEGYYADKAAVVNIGVGLSKTMVINSDFSIPVKTIIAINPHTQKIFLTLGLTL